MASFKCDTAKIRPRWLKGPLSLLILFTLTPHNTWCTGLKFQACWTSKHTTSQSGSVCSNTLQYQRTTGFCFITTRRSITAAYCKGFHCSFLCDDTGNDGPLSEKIKISVRWAFERSIFHKAHLLISAQIKALYFKVLQTDSTYWQCSFTCFRVSRQRRVI